MRWEGGPDNQIGQTEKEIIRKLKKKRNRKKTGFVSYGMTIPNKTDEKCKRKVCVYRFGFSPEQLL